MIVISESSLATAHLFSKPREKKKSPSLDATLEQTKRRDFVPYEKRAFLTLNDDVVIGLNANEKVWKDIESKLSYSEGFYRIERFGNFNGPIADETDALKDSHGPYIHVFQVEPQGSQERSPSQQWETLSEQISASLLYRDADDQQTEMLNKWMGQPVNYWGKEGIILHDKGELALIARDGHFRVAVYDLTSNDLKENAVGMRFKLVDEEGNERSPQDSVPIKYDKNNPGEQNRFVALNTLLDTYLR